MATKWVQVRDLRLGDVIDIPDRLNCRVYRLELTLSGTARVDYVYGSGDDVGDDVLLTELADYIEVLDPVTTG